jgi:hypothetical protein
MPKLRSMCEAYREIKKNDPDTALTYYMFRKLILSGDIPSHKNNGIYLINLYDIDSYFRGGSTNEKNNYGNV